MNHDDIITLVVICIVVWILSDGFVIMYLTDVQSGKVQKNRSVIFPEYYPAEDVSPQRWARALLWPITAVLLIPLGIWLALKAIGHFTAGIASVYKENV